jgi:hypothetical protein
VRPELRWGLAAIAALAIGVTCAKPYAEGAAPYYLLVTRLLAKGHPWEIVSVDVRPGKSNLSAELQLRALIYGEPRDRPLARVVGRVQVGEVIETPLVYWTLLLVWPAATFRRRALLILKGIPIFLALTTLTTGAQLALPMAQASAILAGDHDPVTAWDHWSRFLEAGGEFALELSAAFAAVYMRPGTGGRGLPQPSSAIMSRRAAAGAHEV